MFKNIVVFAAGTAAGATVVYGMFTLGLTVIGQIEEADPGHPLPRNSEERREYVKFWFNTLQK